MQIRRPRGVTVPQLMLVTALGFLGGIYIWKPIILDYKNKSENTKIAADSPQQSEATTKCDNNMNFINFAKQFARTTPGIVAIGLITTFSLLGGYRLVIKPEFERRRHQEAESYANFIYENEVARTYKKEKFT